MKSPTSVFQTILVHRSISRIVFVIVVFALLCLVVSTSAQTVMFGTGATYSAGNGPWGIVSGDFNGDGYPDMAVANHGTEASPGSLGNGVTGLMGEDDGKVKCSYRE